MVTFDDHQHGMEDWSRYGAEPFVGGLKQSIDQLIEESCHDGNEKNSKKFLGMRE